jgi:hypothetical protein
MFLPLLTQSTDVNKGELSEWKFTSPLTVTREACFSLKNIVKIFGFIDLMSKNTAFSVVTPSFHWSCEQEHCVRCGYAFVLLIMWTRTFRSLWLHLRSNNHVNKNTMFAVVTPSVHWSCEQEHCVRCGYTFVPLIMWTRTLRSLWLYLRSIDHVNKNTVFHVTKNTAFAVVIPSFHWSCEQEECVRCCYTFIPFTMWIQ